MELQRRLWCRKSVLTTWFERLIRRLLWCDIIKLDESRNKIVSFNRRRLIQGDEKPFSLDGARKSEKAYAASGEHCIVSTGSLREHMTYDESRMQEETRHAPPPMT